MWFKLVSSPEFICPKEFLVRFSATRNVDCGVQKTAITLRVGLINTTSELKCGKRLLVR